MNPTKSYRTYKEKKIAKGKREQKTQSITPYIRYPVDAWKSLRNK